MASFDFYNDLANSYDELYKEEQFRKYSIVKQYFGKKILDIGCGTGLLVEFLLENQIPFEKYVGIDISKELIAIAKKKFKTKKNIKFILSDATNFDYSKIDPDFDTVVSFTALHNMNNIEFLNQINNKGIFILTLLKKSKKFLQYKKIIEKNFEVIKEFEDIHDIMFISKVCNTKFINYYFLEYLNL